MGLKKKTQQWVFRIGKSAIWEITPFYADKDQMDSWVEEKNKGKTPVNMITEYAKVKHTRETFKTFSKV